MFKTVFHKRFCKIALLISVDVLTECRTRVSGYLPSYISATGMAFSLDTRNVGAYPKLIKICGKSSTYITGLSDQAVQFSDKATGFFGKNKPVPLSLNSQDASILTLKTSVMVKRLKGT